jgi:HEAT repeat protein
VRIAAATNLRLMPAPRADQVLAGLLTAGTDPGLRQAALFVIGFRQFGPLAPALETLLHSEPSADIRMLALNTVVNFLRRDGAQAAEPLIRWSAENDPDESVRRQAKAAIGG